MDLSPAISSLAWSREDACDIDGQAEGPNGAYGKSDIEGKTAREAASELGKERVSNEREGMSQRFRSSLAQGITRHVSFLLSIFTIFAVRPSASLIESP